MKNTAQVAGRRPLHFHGIEDILADVEQLAKNPRIRALGNWPPGQVLGHLTTVMNKSLDGFTERAPAVVRFFLRLLLKKRILTKPMSPGFRLRAKAQTELVPASGSLEEGLPSFRQAIRRLQTETKRAAHPAFGPLTFDEWTQLHCRHAELHLSFLVPEG